MGNSGTGTDCLHVWNLMNAYIVNDNKVIKGYLGTFSPPFKEGHKYTKLIGNLLHKYLGAEYNFNIIEEIEKYKSSTKFEKNTIRALKAVFTNNQELFNEYTEMTIKGYKRTEFAHNFEKYYPFFPIFLTTLNYRINNQLYSNPSIDEFINIIKDTTDINIEKTGYIKLAKQNSKVLYKWISKAPSSINYTELKDEMLLKIKNN